MALRSCLWSVWQPASGQSYKPWENKCFVHIRLQSIRFPLPPLAPFLLSFSDLRDIYRREPACPSLLGAQLVRPFSPAGKWVHLSAPSDETNRWMTGVNHTSVQDESSKTQWGGEGGRGSTELLSSRQWPSCQWSTSWCTVHLGASAEECNSPDILQKHLQTAVMLAVLQRFFSLFFSPPWWWRTSGNQNDCISRDDTKRVKQAEGRSSDDSIGYNMKYEEGLGVGFGVMEGDNIRRLHPCESSNVMLTQQTGCGEYDMQCT